MDFLLGGSVVATDSKLSLTTTSAGFKLNQNNAALLSITNSTSGTLSSANIVAISDVASIRFQVESSTTTLSGMYAPNDAIVRAFGAGHRLVLNSDDASGSIIFGVGVNSSASSNRGNINSSGNWFFGGATSASSTVHIKAGSATANTAPLQLTSGPLETVIRGGLHEYNNAHYLSSSALNRYAPGGSIADFTTDVGNSGSAETDLFTYTTKASTLSATGEKLVFTITGNIIGSATASRTINLYFAGTNIGTVAAATISTTGNFRAIVDVIRTGSTTARTSTSISVDNLTLATPITETDLTGLTFTNTNIIKITGTSSGTGSATNDIVAKLGWINWFPSSNN
jgi:cytoskeletal protein CcmA (bactofilin family)